MTANYKIGWTGTGDWYNYTRTIPQGTYQVWAALSADGAALAGRLDLVTSAATETNQTTQALGAFAGPATGGWGLNSLVPMQGPNTNGINQVVSLGGTQTLRFYTDSGDFDYLVLEPAVAPLQISSITVTPAGKIEIQWTGGGTLQSSPTMPATQWTAVPGASPAVLDPPATGNLFYRVAE